MLAAPVILRRDPDLGLLAILLLFTIVWTTTSRLFRWRAFGGPKLMPRSARRKPGRGRLPVRSCDDVLRCWSRRFFGAFDAIAIAAIALAAVNMFASGGSARILDQAQIRRQGCSQLIPGHGGLRTARRFLGGSLCGLRDRTASAAVSIRRRAVCWYVSYDTDRHCTSCSREATCSR